MGNPQFLQVWNFFLQASEETWMRHARRRMFSKCPDMKFIDYRAGQVRTRL